MDGSIDRSIDFQMIVFTLFFFVSLTKQKSDHTNLNTKTILTISYTCNIKEIITLLFITYKYV